MKNEDWFERIWEYREETLYPEMFGGERQGIFPIPFDRLQKGGITDPRWSTCGVFRFSPDEKRRSWLYVSSGLSNEWFAEKPDPENTSGFGCEFVFETNIEADWPIQRLHQIMVYQIGICCGKYEGQEPLSDWHRIPLGSAIDWKESSIEYFVVVPPERFPQEMKQESGTAGLYQLFGLTEAEVLYAREGNNDRLVTTLKQKTKYPVTDPERESVV